MAVQPLCVFPVKAPVQQAVFPLVPTLLDCLQQAGVAVQDGDVLAVSSKYAAISEGRIVDLASVTVTAAGAQLAERYNMLPQLAQLVLNEADVVLGGIPMGFLLTATHGIISPNAGLDRSNIPSGKVVLFPQFPYHTAEQIRQQVQAALNVRIGVVLTDSWLMPGRLGTTGVALASAGFLPTQDERGKQDLFGNPMAVTVRGIADGITVAAQLVMGERDEATPFAVVRNSGAQLTEERLSAADVAIDWRQCIYVESLTKGLVDPSVLAAVSAAPPYQPKAVLGKNDHPETMPS